MSHSFPECCSKVSLFLLSTTKLLLNRFIRSLTSQFVPIMWDGPDPATITSAPGDIPVRSAILLMSYLYNTQDNETTSAGLKIRVVLWPQSTKTSFGPPDIAMGWSGGLLETFNH